MIFRIIEELRGHLDRSYNIVYNISAYGQQPVKTTPGRCTCVS
jgi:hypothetical protein